MIIGDIMSIQIAPGEVLLGDKDKNIFARIPYKSVKGIVGEIMRAEGEAEKLLDLTKQVDKLLHDNNNGDVKTL